MYDVTPGIDSARNQRFRALAGKRVGLVTNHTGVCIDGQSTIDVLYAAERVHLSVLFGPEHGIRGDHDSPVTDTKDERTGLPIYSLYGERHAPDIEQLRLLDALIFDIQDVGARFYTYLSTLGLCLEACAKAGVEFVVMDRPNPIGGVAVEGPCAEEKLLSFVAHHTVPVRHGLTMGEAARLLNDERRLNAALTVEPVKGWKRASFWDETGLLWVNPSPNMRCLTQALLYPGICLLEYSNVSVGRGTDTPFEVIGAPWIDARMLSNSLNTAGLHGVRFVPIRFKPNSSTFAGTICEGVNIIITERSKFKPVLTGVAIMERLHKLYGTRWQLEKCEKLLGSAQSMRLLLAGETAPALNAMWQHDAELFYARRRPHLLY